MKGNAIQHPKAIPTVISFGDHNLISIHKLSAMLKKAKPYSRYVIVSIETIKEHIDANPFQFRTAAELLDHLTTPHRNSVERAFKDMYGVGIKQYQVMLRLEASKRFLEQTMNMKTITSKCFYKSHTSYSRAFKKAFNVTPTEWQNMHR
jgi:transcriptional regulator GlxA family with amidase domain